MKDYNCKYNDCGWCYKRKSDYGECVGVKECKHHPEGGTMDKETKEFVIKCFEKQGLKVPTSSEEMLSRVPVLKSISILDDLCEALNIYKEET